MRDTPRIIGRNYIASPDQAGGRTSPNYGNTRLDDDFHIGWKGYLIGGFVFACLFYAWIG